MAFQQARPRPPPRAQYAPEPSTSHSLTAPAPAGVSSEPFVINAPQQRSPQQNSPTSTSSQLSSVNSPEWTVLNLSAVRPHSARVDGRSLSFSSVSAGSSAALSSPGLAQQALPQHNGRGQFFRQGEAVDSQTDNLTSSEDDQLGLGLGATVGGVGPWAGRARPRNSSLASEAESSASNWSPDNLTSNQAQLLPTHQPISNWATTSLSASRASASGSELGSSWALTEAALASLPDITASAAAGGGGLLLTLGSPVRPASRASAVLTDSDAADEADASADSDDGQNEPWAASAGLSSVLRRRRLVRSTPASQVDASSVAKSQSSQSWAGPFSRGRIAYPSPPPEEQLAQRGNKATQKRRHRQAGKGSGSQKRSSNGGSVNGSQGGRTRAAHQVSHPPSLATVAAKTQAEADAEQRALLEAQHMAERGIAQEEQRRRVAAAAASGLFLGGWAARLTRCDAETLELFADADGDSYLSQTDIDYYSNRGGQSTDPTPTQSRASSPRRAHRGLVAGGLAALSRYAQEELGEVAEAFHREIREQAEEEDSGAETEREEDGVRWSKQYRPPSPALSTGAVNRSHSARSLPAYLAGSAQLKMTSGRLRSNSSSSVEGRTRKGRSTLDEDGEERVANAWGGEFEGREAALSYWRRILRRMRGF